MLAAALRSGTSHFLRTQLSSNATLGFLGSSRYHSCENVAKLHTSHLFENLMRNLGTLTAKRSNVLVPYQMSFHRLIHSGGENDTETGRTSEPRDFMNGMQGTESGRNSRPMGFVREIQGTESGRTSRPMDFAREMQGAESGRISRPMDFAREIQGTETGRTSRPMDFMRGRQYGETGRTSRPMDYVRGILEEDRRGMIGASQFPRYTIEQNADVVHIKLLRNNTFVTVTDSKGNTKCRASSGCLPEMKGGTKLSRYASEATAEHVGRLAKQMGLKSVVVKVKGFTYFKKKKQAIMSFREGFANSRSDQNSIVYLEDTTRRPHNGCRLPKRRRI